MLRMITFPPPLTPPPGAGNWINLYILGGYAAQKVQIGNFLPFSPAAGEKGPGDEGVKCPLRNMSS